jgi:hypothetical protein
MKDFPLNELLAATDLSKVQDSILLIFSHLNKKLKLSPYPVRRALPLVEAISRDLNSQLLRVLSSQRLTYMSYPAFERAMASSAAVFAAWDDSFKEFTNVAREVTRKRSEKFIPIKIQPAHASLQERVGYLRGFRKQHHQLSVMVGPLGSETKRIGGGAEDGKAGEVEGETKKEWASALGDIDMDAEVRFVLPSLFLLPALTFLLPSKGPSSLREHQERRCSRRLDRFVPFFSSLSPFSHSDFSASLARFDHLPALRSFLLTSPSLLILPLPHLRRFSSTRGN